MKTKIVLGGRGINLKGEFFATTTYTGRVLNLKDLGFERGVFWFSVTFKDKEKLFNQMNVKDFIALKGKVSKGEEVTIKRIMTFLDSSPKIDTQEAVLC